MATILRGNHKGDKIEIHQFCNDWITDKEGNVWNPTSLEFTPEEILEITYADMHKQCGIMFRLYHFQGNRLYKIIAL